GATSWAGGTTLSGSATSFVDSGVAVGTPYEYAVVKNAGGYQGYGYVPSGINVPLVENRGKVVLVVERTYAAQLASELNRLQQDLVGDGWTVLRHDVGRSDSVVSVKNLIKADYNAEPSDVKGVFLFGHVPVPYSGQLNPDGHAEHVVADYFGVRNGEAFAASAYRNFAAFFRASNIDNLNLINTHNRGVCVLTIESNDYLWAHGSGAGSYNSVSGLGNAGNYHSTTTQ